MQVAHYREPASDYRSPLHRSLVAVEPCYSNNNGSGGGFASQSVYHMAMNGEERSGGEGSSSATSMTLPRDFGQHRYDSAEADAGDDYDDEYPQADGGDEEGSGGEQSLMMRRRDSRRRRSLNVARRIDSLPSLKSLFNKFRKSRRKYSKNCGGDSTGHHNRRAKYSRTPDCFASSEAPPVRSSNSRDSGLGASAVDDQGQGLCPGQGSTGPGGRTAMDTEPASTSAASSVENELRSLRLSACSEGATPALCGIKNHSNTCYINAVVQCLSNTELLAEYFVSDRHLHELTNSMRNADKYGTCGDITIAFATLLKSLWYYSYTPSISNYFKAVTERYCEQYRGDRQQDAHEFLNFLLDRMHEDLNTGKKRKYKAHTHQVENQSEAAAKIMEKHLEAHNSFISHNFHGLFQSTVTCLTCLKSSTSYDPFLCVSLPVSQDSKRPLYVIVVFLFRKPRQICYGVNAETTATFQQVKECLDEITGLSTSEVEFYQVSEFGFACSYDIVEEVHVLGPVNCVYAIELPSLPADTPYGEELILIVCNIVQFADRSKRFRRFGSPFVVNVQRDIPYDELIMLILKETHLPLKTNAHLQMMLSKMLDLFILDECNESRYIPPDVSLPFYVEAVDNILMQKFNGPGSSRIMVHLLWPEHVKQNFIVGEEELIAEHQSAVVMKQGTANSSAQTLIDCVARYTKPEVLPWYCPGCREYKEEAEKRIVFCWLPDVLIFHLQRFKQTDAAHLIKLDARVEFPLTDLNLNQFTNQNGDYIDAYKHSSRGLSSGKAAFGKLYTNSRESNNVYDLFATCNHHGDSPDAGHYTAYCRNPVNGRWYHFDDQVVKEISERDVVTNSAYLLFYERRIPRTSSCTRNISESGFIEHWFFQLTANHGGKNVTSNQQLSKPSMCKHNRGVKTRDESQQLDSLESLGPGYAEFNSSTSQWQNGGAEQYADGPLTLPPQPYCGGNRTFGEMMDRERVSVDCDSDGVRQRYKPICISTRSSFETDI